MGPVKILLLQNNIQKAICWTFIRYLSKDFFACQICSNTWRLIYCFINLFLRAGPVSFLSDMTRGHGEADIVL